jgi:hypothetical protein
MTTPVQVLLVGPGSDLARIAAAHLAAAGMVVHGPVDVHVATTMLARVDALLLDLADAVSDEALLGSLAAAREGRPDGGTLVAALVAGGLDRARATTLLARGVRHVLAAPFTREDIVRAFGDVSAGSGDRASEGRTSAPTSDQL